MIMNIRMKKLLILLAALLHLWLAACGRREAPALPADPSPVVPATTAPTLPPATSAAIATTPPSITPTTSAVALPADSLMTGPLVGFYIEDTYEDLYLSIYDAGTGTFRVIQSATPIYIDEAQWFDGGCRLFVHGQVTDLHGAVEWSLPPEVAARINYVNIARLSPGRGYVAHAAAGERGDAADIEIIALSPPYDAVRLTSGDGVRAFVWSADGTQLYHTGYDESGVLQVYRASADGATREQLTAHGADSGGVGAITGLSLSPDERYLAYSVQNLLSPSHPYTYQPADEGWVGIIDLVAGTSAAVRPTKFGSAEAGRGLVWDAAGENLLIIGDSLPIAADDPDAGRRLLWVTPDGEVTRALATADGPEGAGGHMGWVAPLGDINTLLVSVLNDFYLYEDGAFRRLDAAEAPPLGLELGRRPFAVLPAPIGFPGEAACGD